MTKQEILDRFSDIDFVYNDSSKHETLSRMLDELLKEQQEQIDKLIEENASNAEMAEGLKELLKEQDDMGKELTDAMELIRKKNERIEKLLKEQEKKSITVRKRHVITLRRNDIFSMRNLYESICETLMDEGSLIIVRKDDHEKVDFEWEIVDNSET